MLQLRRQSPGPGIGPRRAKSSDTTSGSIAAEGQLSDLLGTAEDDSLYCSDCGRMITSSADRIAVNGAHCHRLSNPAGMTYRVGCFRSADGCLDHGEPTFGYTWFAGFAWSIAFCSSCHVHLGWRYQSGDRHFFGLILDRLVSGSRTL